MDTGGNHAPDCLMRNLIPQDSNLSKFTPGEICGEFAIDDFNNEFLIVSKEELEKLKILIDHSIECCGCSSSKMAATLLKKIIP